jgi:hypothetical protein
VCSSSQSSFDWGLGLGLGLGCGVWGLGSLMGWWQSFGAPPQSRALNRARRQRMRAPHLSEGERVCQREGPRVYGSVPVRERARVPVWVRGDFRSVSESARGWVRERARVDSSVAECQPEDRCRPRLITCGCRARRSRLPRGHTLSRVCGGVGTHPPATQKSLPPWPTARSPRRTCGGRP